MRSFTAVAVSALCVSSCDSPPRVDARWALTARHEPVEFALAGGAARAYRVTVVPSAAFARLPSSARVMVELVAGVSGTLEGSPRPAALTAELSSPAEPSARPAAPLASLSSRHSRAVSCAATSGCTPAFRLVIRWPDAPASKSARVRVALVANLTGEGAQESLSGAGVTLALAPEP